MKHTEINFESILSIMYVKEMPNLYTHIKLRSLRGVGRRGWEGRLENGVRMKYMITLD